MIQAGELNQRVTVQAGTSVQDDAGQPIVTWATFAGPLPAKVESVAGGETIRGRQVVATATTLFTVRWLTGVTPKMRLSYEGRTLNILRAGDPYGDRRELRIEAAEVQ
jgi:SPP1 family predicted phage head-tail adaptor